MVVNSTKQKKGCVVITRHEKIRTGAAIIEAVLVMPVLLVALLVVYQFHRASLLASNAAVAARTEITLDSAKMNANNWTRFKPQDRNEHGQLFINKGLAPYAATFNINTDLRESDKSWLEKLAKILTASQVVNVEFKLTEDSLVKNILGREITGLKYKYSGTCAIDPWALTVKRFFGFLAGLLDTTIQDNKRTLEDEIAYEPIPE